MKAYIWKTIFTLMCFSFIAIAKISNEAKFKKKKKDVPNIL